MSKSPDKNSKKPTEAEEAKRPDTSAKTSDNTVDESDALESFLNRSYKRPESSKSPAEKRRLNRAAILLIVAVAVVLALVFIFIYVHSLPEVMPTDEANYIPAEIETMVTKSSEHEVIVPTDPQGEPLNNGAGELLEYYPTDIKEITVSNTYGKFTVAAGTTKDGASVYTLLGFEDYPLQQGMPDAVANDASQQSFTTIVSTKGNLSDFGLDEPRAVVKVKYTDATMSTIKVGNEAAAGAGTYITFGNNNTVYLVSNDSVDSFLYKNSDLISRTVTATPETVESTSFSSLTISGSRYPKAIEMEPNPDASIDYEYYITAPTAMFGNPLECADISGSIRDIFAEEVVDVLPLKGDLNAFLTKYGLAEPYARVHAVYPDAVIDLSASKPSDNGDVYLISESGESYSRRIVYRISGAALSWTRTSVEALTPDTILNVKKDAVKNIKISAGGKDYSINVNTRTQTVSNDSGGEEEITTTEAEYDDRLLDSDGFSILFKNLSSLPNDRKDAAKGTSLLYEVTYTYSTDRSPDTISIYDNGSGECYVTRNGEPCGTTAKKYVNGLIKNITDLIAGKLPENL